MIATSVQSAPSPVISVTGNDVRAVVAFADGVVVKLYTILGCKALGCADAYAPSSPFGNHSSITTLDGNSVDWYGQIGTERISADLEALPAYSRERSEAVRAHYAERKAIAAEYIAAARRAMEG